MTRKPGYQFGWDWGPRLAGPGIAGPVVLEPWILAQGEGKHLPWLEVVQLSDHEARLVLHNRGHWDLDLTLDGNSVEAMVEHDTLVVPHPEIWWPVHMGAQPLYGARGRTRKREVRGAQFGHPHAGMAEKSTTHGDVIWPARQRPTRACQGANVVPPDFHEAHSDEGWRHIVANAKLRT